MEVSVISYSAIAQALNGPRALQDPVGLNKVATEIDLIIAEKQRQVALQQVQPTIPLNERQGPKKIDVYV